MLLFADAESLLNHARNTRSTAHTAFYEWDQKVCERTTCNMRIAGVQYANGISAIRILFPRLESYFICILIFTIPLLQHKSDNEFPLKPE